MKNESNKPGMAVRILCGVLIGALLLGTVVLLVSVLV